MIGTMHNNIKRLNESKRVSLQRTLQTLDDNILLNKSLSRGRNGYRLNKYGIEKSKELREEIKAFIEEYQPLIT